MTTPPGTKWITPMITVISRLSGGMTIHDQAKFAELFPIDDKHVVGVMTCPGGKCASDKTLSITKRGFSTHKDRKRAFPRVVTFRFCPYTENPNMLPCLRLSNNGMCHITGTNNIVVANRVMDILMSVLKTTQFPPGVVSFGDLDKGYNSEIKLINSLVLLEDRVTLDHFVEMMLRSREAKKLECPNHTKLLLVATGIKMSCLLDKVTQRIKLQVFGAKSVSALDDVKAIIAKVLLSCRIVDTKDVYSIEKAPQELVLF